jgi:hypothetical protein
MPTFPTYDGELPKCLNPLNLRHYWLVLYWVFFRPTALKCYLYQASPKIYKSDGGWKYFFQCFKLTAYRNLFLISSISTILISFFIIFLGLYFQEPIHILAIPNDSYAAQSSNAYALILKSLLSKHPILTRFTFSIFVAAILGGFLNIVLSVAYSTVLGSVVGIASGISLGISASLASLSLSIGMAIFPAMGSMALGIAGGVSYGAGIGIEYGVTYGIILSALMCIFLDVNMGFSIAVGALRLPFYFLEFFGFLFVSRSINSHSISWDELGVLPL